jgi:hypothetical protein
LLGN